MDDFEFPNHDYTYVLYTSLSSDGPYVLDWISYHLCIGFTHFAIAVNECDDHTKNLLRQLISFGIVSIRNNPAPHPQGTQKHSMMRLQDMDAIKNAEWLMHLEIDEYLRIDVGKGELMDLISGLCGLAQAVSFVCQLFGNSGVDEFIDAPVISQFTKAAHPLQVAPAPLCALKTFYKNGYFKKLAPNRPAGIRDDVNLNEFDWFDADGISTKKLIKSQISEASQNGFAFGTALGRVNRYPVQSLDAYSNKWHKEQFHMNHSTQVGELAPHEYWLRNNWNNVNETKILKHLDAANVIKQKFMDNENIKKLHRKTFRLHRQSANQLRRKNKSFYQDFENLQPLDFGAKYPLISEEDFVPKLNEWLANTKQLNQKMLVTNLLKYYIEHIDYSPSSTKFMS